MNKNNTSRLLPLGISGGGIFIFFGIMFFLYRQSQYHPFLLGSIFFLLLGCVNLILLLFHADIPIKKKEESSISKETLDGEATPQPSKEATKTLASSTAGKLLQMLLRLLKPLPFMLGALFNRFRTWIMGISLFTALLGFGIYFGKVAFTPVLKPLLQYWHLVTLVALFIVAIILDKFCKHAEPKDSFLASLLKNARAFFNIAKLLLLGTTAAVALYMLNIYDICTYLIYGILVVFYYVLAMLVLSLGVRIIRKELSTMPTIVILLPFVATDAKELSVISFLEENTGITLRSLWSIKYIRKIIPTAVLIVFAIFWASTGIVYVESHQEGVVYRFGTMKEEVLKPGLHWNLPYPIDKTEIYDTQTVNKVTIGYKAEENVDNVWTKNHGDSEYKLLLGSGNELVSLNLRVEYKIDDLKEYLRSASAPDRIVEAKAYELTTSRTINTDLDTLLATDREAFANSFCEELAAKVEESHTGIKVVSVILESIHPPVEVAEVYQDFIAVEIDSERIITQAHASAAVRLYEAQSTSNSIVNNANALYYERVAAARYEVASFMASVAAYEESPDTYVYYKYLNAIGTAYQNANLVILGEGVDGSRIWWGSFQTEN